MNRNRKKQNALNNVNQKLSAVLEAPIPLYRSDCKEDDFLTPETSNHLSLLYCFKYLENNSIYSAEYSQEETITECIEEDWIDENGEISFPVDEIFPTCFSQRSHQMVLTFVVEKCNFINIQNEQEMSYTRKTTVYTKQTSPVKE